jgi:hypothetical protein
MRPELVGIAQVVLGLEQDGLGIETGNPSTLAGENLIVFAEGIELFRQQGGESTVLVAFLHLHRLVSIHAAPHFVVVADDFAVRAIQALELLMLAILVGDMGDARGFYVPAILIDEGAAVIGLVRRKRDGLQPVQIHLSRPDCQRGPRPAHQQQQRQSPPWLHCCRPPCTFATVRM